MRHRSRIANLPVRMATGAFVLSSGLTKLKAEGDTANHLHGFAAGAYPFLEKVPPEQFVRGLGAAEVALGGALLAPVLVGDRLAGLGLTAFAGGLIGLYAKTPGMRREGSIRPSQDGTALAKDTWLAGIGLTLLASSVTTARRNRLERKSKKRQAGARKREAGARK